MATYVAGMIPPHQAATTGTAALALAGELTSVFNSWTAGTYDPDPCVNLAPFEAAFANFATLIKDSPDTLGIYEGTAIPPADVGFCNIGIQTTHASAAAAFATAIDAWFKTGTSSLILTPFTTVTWS